MIEPGVLEAMVVREALSLALDLHIQKIQVATDCRATMNPMIINDIKDLLVDLK